MSISMMSLTPSSSSAVGSGGGIGKPMPPPVPPKPLIQNFPAFPQRISPPVPPKPRRAISTMALNSGPNRYLISTSVANFGFYVFLFFLQSYL